MTGSGVFVGVDVGSTTVKVAGVTAEASMIGQPVYLRLDEFSSQVDAVKHAVESYLQSAPRRVAGLGVTGSGRELTRVLLGADMCRTEIFAHAAGLNHILGSGAVPGVSRAGALIEIGGQDSKVIVFDESGLPAYFNMNTICSAGTGEFLKQLADEAAISLDDVGQIALQSTSPAVIDATCTVFSKRDFRHLTQKGVPLPDRLMGACQALVRNFISNVARDVELRPPVFFQGGVAANQAVRKAFEDQLRTAVYVTPHNGVVGALGMAVSMLEGAESIEGLSTRFCPDFAERNFKVQVRYCRGCANGCDLTQPYEIRDGKAVVVDTLGGRCDGCNKPRNVHESPGKPGMTRIAVHRHSRKADAPPDLIYADGKPQRSSEGRLFAGLDGGSRGTKYVLIRSVREYRNGAPAARRERHDMEILASGSVDTSGDAVAAALNSLRMLRGYLPRGEKLAAIGTTGSAGELFRDIITGRTSDTADIRCTEIIAHYVWASYWQPDVGTVMDIGGNDAKLILVRNGTLDFAMNDKCAAGTGSFLEAVARRFGVSLEQFANLAVESLNPARIAGRCAVFGESDIIHKSRLGFAPSDLFMGLAHAVCRTYLSDLCRGRPLQAPIVAQGGAFLSAPLQQAFRQALGLSPDEFIVSPDPTYVLGAGALGAALMARGRWELGFDSHFKGFDAILGNHYTTAVTTCSRPGCHRRCGGVVALLENGEPLAGYKSIDCAFGHFSGFAASDEERDHIRAALADTDRMTPDGGRGQWQ